MRSRRSRVIVLLAITLTFTAAAIAQQQRSPSRSQQLQSQQQQNADRARIVADPQGWVMVGYDTDGDQNIDAYEYIHIYDLRQAEQRSRQRAGGEFRTQLRQTRPGRGQDSQMMQGRGRQDSRMMQGRSRQGSQMMQNRDRQDSRMMQGRGREDSQMMQGRGRQGSQMMQGRGQQQWSQTGQQQRRGQGSAATQRRQVSGTIQDTKQVQLAQQRQKHTFAKVRTQQGRTVVVDLGPSNRVNQLNLSRGDRIQAQGQVSMVNQRPVLMSEQVRANNQTIRLETPQGSRTKRLEGTITRTATRRLRGQNQPAHVIALVELETGQKVPVDLGRQSDLQDVSISEGKDITLLARSAKIGDRTILVAESMGIDGHQVDVQWLRGLRQRQRQGSSGWQGR